MATIAEKQEETIIEKPKQCTTCKKERNALLIIALAVLVIGGGVWAFKKGYFKLGSGATAEAEN